MTRYLVLFLTIAAGTACAATNDPPDTSIAFGAYAAPANLSMTELENLVAPIALYPDPLLGLILPASVFPDQIVDAALLIRSKADAPLIAQQDWDGSVKSIATYPGVLKMMHEKIDWTTKLGNAFLNQSPELRTAIQTLRLQAQKVGNLKTTEEQRVSTKVVDGQSVVVIEPTQPQVVYVPQYTTEVYHEPAQDDSNYLVPLATFGLGMALGSAMSDDDDDDVHVYGGYPGYVAWYDNDAAEDWRNFRQDRLEDRTNYRQDMRQDRQNFRQDQIESGNWNKDSAKQFRQQQQANRQERASQVQNNRASLTNSQAAQAAEQRRQSVEQRKQSAQQRSNEWKSSASDRGWSSGAMGDRARENRSSRSSSAFSGYSSRSAASAYGSRGSMSRSAGGYGRSGGGGARRGGGGGGRRR